MKNRLRRQPVYASVKESVDNLPMGVCLADRRGMILLLNRSMSGLSHAVAGQDLQDAEAFWRVVTEGRLAVGAERLPYGNAPVIALSDGTVWAFSRSRIALGDKPVTQILASEITELDAARQQLQEANRRLRAMNDRLKQYGRDVIEVTAREERLTAKMRIHDELGSALLATRRYLLEGGEGAEHILEQWRRNVRVLRGSAEEPPRTTAAVLANAAQALGVTLCIEGALPEEKKAEALLLSALSEALNNAVRHAGATRLDVRITRGETGVSAQITNDGAPPAGPIAEGGGLSALRRSLETAGGSMEIESLPEFRLLLNIPGSEEALQ